jgi:hypothetical protein
MVPGRKEEEVMNAPNTRVATLTLRELVTDAAAHLDALESALSVLLPALTPEDRKAMPRTRSNFTAKARVLADLMKRRPDIAEIAHYSADTVLEDLDNVELIEPLLPRLESLAQRVSDSRLQWLAEAQEPTLAAYGVAKTLARRDGSLAALIEPLKKVLSNTRKPEEPEERPVLLRSADGPRRS